LYRFEVNQKKIEAHQEKNEAKKWVRFFACALEKGAKRVRLHFETRNASKPKQAHLTQSRERRVEVGSEECSAKVS
jgi:hypothetical protein